ncbi:MAG: S24 family peptidase [Acetobacteraceae bacterium]
MQHKDIWRALDTLAAEHGLSVSGLARRAGLDPTTFTPAKRRLANGRARWPSTESLAKVLEATRTPIDAFTALVSGARALPASASRAACRRLPLLAHPGHAAEFFDASGRPKGTASAEITLPGVGDPTAYALALADDAMAPLFRSGDVVIASPAAPVRHGDRVLVRLSEGALIARELIERAARRVVLRHLFPAPTETLVDSSKVTFVHRIIWARQ